MLTGLPKELVFLILQLESESGLFCNAKYIEELVLKGDWEVLENYLAGFISVNDNRYSVKMLFEIRKQRYIEALDSKDRAKALEILNKDLKAFKSVNGEVFKEMTHLLTIGDIRENAQLSKYTDHKTARAILIDELRKLIESNPDLRDKRQFPPSLQPPEVPVFLATSRGQGSVNPLPTLTQHPVSGVLVRAAHNTADSELVLRRSRHFGMSEEIKNLPTSSVVRPTQGHMFNFLPTDELPKNVISAINQGSEVKTMDFHPEYQTLLLVGTNTGDFSIWEISSRLRIAHRNFSVWNIGACSMALQFIFSTAIDGKFKAWLYDEPVSKIDYETPGYTWIRMAYSTDGSRFFSSGASQDRDSYLVEWNENEGTVKRTYHGLGKHYAGVVQFHTANRFLAAGDEYSVKFWDMDNKFLLFSTNADGGLPASPCIRFSKDGILLAVSTADNGVKILANPEGLRLVKSIENQPDTIRLASANAAKAGIASSSSAGANIGFPDRSIQFPVMAAVNQDNQNMQEIRGRNTDEVEFPIISRPKEITEPFQLRSLRLPDNLFPVKATADMTPQLWQPASGILMTNDIREANLEDNVPSLALSKNSSYVLSASGGKISLFNLSTFKVSQKLTSHQKCVTGLAFAIDKKILVSTGADAQICVWNTDTWEKLTSKSLKLSRRTNKPQAETRVQFNPDQTHFMVVHETQIAVYDPLKLDSCLQWFPRPTGGSIADAVYSCDGESVFVCIEDGSVNILAANHLKLKCRINYAAYMPSKRSAIRVCPNAIAAHPSDPSQLAVGLSDGGVYVLEPLESDKQWGGDPSSETSAGPSTNPDPDQTQAA
ncbi:hypothetical protein L1987_45137 [Smallanthus sonchifolius]|uniref:Uncharacterized protein n=1 Tax=Smallanthus sonchifolius TaxID=185202 RepID=A0ACB9GSE8_9ASTR|nr:hypothetical protein L1987_45137 [Smallanthus sonchifolius]